jgi:hypothetical protein
LTLSRRGILAGAAALVASAAAATRAARAGDAQDRRGVGSAPDGHGAGSAPDGHGAGSAPDALLARIAKARAALRTLVGPFTQTRTIGLLSTDVRSTGTVALLMPDRLRWRLDPPDDVTFWIGPEGLAYRSAHGQGRVPKATARAASAMQDLHALLGGDVAKLSERWALKILRDDATGVELEAELRSGVSPQTGLPVAPPGGPPPGPQQMRFSLAPDLVRPTHVLLVEGEHDRTVIDFGTLVIDGPLDETSMRPA